MTPRGRSLFRLLSPSPKSMTAVLRDRVLVGQAGALCSLCPTQICRIWCCLRPSSAGHQLCIWTILECLSRELRFSWGEMLDPPSPSHPSLQVCPLANVHSANSACPPNRAALVNNPSPFPCGAMGATCLRVFGESRSHSAFLHRLTGPDNGVLCSPRVWK